MGVPTPEVGYTNAMPRREDHEVHKDMWGIGGGEKHCGTRILWNVFGKLNRESLGLFKLHVSPP